jgi:hypothetical protein
MQLSAARPTHHTVSQGSIEGLQSHSKRINEMGIKPKNHGRGGQKEATQEDEAGVQIKCGCIFKTNCIHTYKQHANNSQKMLRRERKARMWDAEGRRHRAQGWCLHATQERRGVHPVAAQEKG